MTVNNKHVCVISWFYKKQAKQTRKSLKIKKKRRQHKTTKQKQKNKRERNKNTDSNQRMT